MLGDAPEPVHRGPRGHRVVCGRDGRSSPGLLVCRVNAAVALLGGVNFAPKCAPLCVARPRLRTRSHPVAGRSPSTRSRSAWATSITHVARADGHRHGPPSAGHSAPQPRQERPRCCRKRQEDSVGLPWSAVCLSGGCVCCWECRTSQSLKCPDRARRWGRSLLRPDRPGAALAHPDELH